MVTLAGLLAQGNEADVDGNGTVTAFNLHVSTDGTAFTKVVSDGAWPANGKRKFINFAPVSARYVRFEVLAGVGNFASAAEVSFSATPLAAPPAEPGRVTVLAAALVVSEPRAGSTR